ncbi:PAS domain S-box-containing protein [Quadrisphaera granulorum]|uniref:PAS domain S-box-containing protein n=1 Tax=Quadrisphaera granulorum TaxID=317664 RepID=A0A316A0B9_9ACTN|nr:GAF domain-containing SpoIIE family protein phosphatase [Quadrisphaera granulorum]PWJ51135.1 PAS domain S-box-containing protein [Quadrisphaera granulorum]SZE97785.1 PAS domain S-box-containing protein [Quadrisphaera granulorum]
MTADGQDPLRQASLGLELGGGARLMLPRGVAQVRPDAPAAVLVVDLAARRVLYANEVAAQLAPGLTLPVTVEDWSAAADLRDLDGEQLDETAHPLWRIARFEPVAGQGVSAARHSDMGRSREPLWVVALPLDDAPDLQGRALVVFLPVRDREEMQQRAQEAHAAASPGPGGAAGRPGAAGSSGQSVSLVPVVPLVPLTPSGAQDDDGGVLLREAAVLATGLSFTVADAHAPDLPLVWVNPAFTAVTGYTFEQAVGRNCRFLQGPGSDPASALRMREALETGRSITEVLLNYRADGTAFWNQVAMSPVVDANGEVTHYVGIQTDVSGRIAADAERDRALAAEQAARAEVEVANARLRLLAEVTRQLSEVTDARVAVDRLAHLVVPDLADFAMIAVVGDDTSATSLPDLRYADVDDEPDAPDEAAGDGDGDAGGASQRASSSDPAAPARPPRRRRGLRDVAWWHHDADRRTLVREIATRRLSELNEAGNQLLLSLLGPDAVAVAAPGTPPDGRSVAEDLARMMRPGRARDALLALNPSSMATWSLRSGGRTLGLLTVGTDREREPLTQHDVDLGSDIAARAGLALDRSRLYRQQRDLAEGLQRSLLTLSPGAVPSHVDVAVRYVAAAEAARVGGDFYDVFTQPGGAAVAVIGDVMGHDTDAAASMAQLRSTVRTLGMLTDDGPAEVLRRADALMRASGMDTTATSAVVRLAAPGDVSSPVPAHGDEAPAVLVEWSNAGHPPPLVLAKDGVVRLLTAPSTDLLLGVDPATRRRQTKLSLGVGATLLLYTDGLVERRDQPLLQGIRRLQQVVKRVAPQAADLHQLLDLVLEEMLPPVVTDDVAVVALRLTCPPP